MQINMVQQEKDNEIGSKSFCTRKRRNTKSTVKKDEENVIVKGELKLELDGRRLYISGKEINLTAKEFDLLELLITNPDKIYSRDSLLSTIWGYEYASDARTVDVHVRRLREKIEENPSEPRYVHTKWGMGYYFKG